MPQHSAIEIVLERPEAIFIPGDSIRGNLILNSLGVVKAKYLYVSLTGTCSTRVKAGRPVSGHGGFKSESETIEFLRIVSELDEDSVFSPGEYSFPFSILVPGNCFNSRANLESRGLDESWTTTQLPSSQKSSQAIIRYKIKGICRQQEILSMAIQCKFDVLIASLLASHHQELPETHVCSSRTLKFYDRDQETWGQWSKRIAGFDTATEKTEVRLALDVVQSMRVDTNPLDCFRKLQVTAPRRDFEIREFTIRIVYKMEVIARLYINDVTETRKLYHDEYVRISDSGSLLPLQDSFRLDCGGLEVSQSTPNWTTTALLEVVVKVQPLSGSPILPVVIREQAPIEVYYAHDGDVSGLSRQVLIGDEVS